MSGGVHDLLEHPVQSVLLRLLLGLSHVDMVPGKKNSSVEFIPKKFVGGGWPISYISCWSFQYLIIISMSRVEPKLIQKFEICM